MKYRDESIRMNLQMRVNSEQADNLVQQIGETTWRTAGKKRAKASKAHLLAVAAIIADLLKAERICTRSYCYHVLGKDAFTGDEIGYRLFKQVIDSAKAEGLIEQRVGYGGPTVEEGRAARFRGTAAFFKLAAKHGVTPKNLETHFRSLPRPTKVADPVIRRGGGSRTAKGRKVPGKPLPFHPGKHPVSTIIKQVEAINGFMAGVAIEPHWSHLAFHRVFNDGDKPGFAWNKGGRLYSIGGGYQSMKQEDRKAIKLNGEATAELDIRASHLTILHALLGSPFDPATRDPYDIPGIDRDVVKTFVTMTLGHDKFHTKWSPQACSRYRTKELEKAKSFGGSTKVKELGEVYPFKKVKEEVVKALPVFKAWDTCPYRWGDLQFLESRAIIDTVEELAKQGIPALPVHDSIIVPASKVEVATMVLKANFTKYVKVEPFIRAK